MNEIWLYIGEKTRNRNHLRALYNKISSAAHHFEGFEVVRLYEEFCEYGHEEMMLDIGRVMTSGHSSFCDSNVMDLVL